MNKAKDFQKRNKKYKPYKYLNLEYKAKKICKLNG